MVTSRAPSSLLRVGVKHRSVRTVRHLSTSLSNGVSVNFRPLRAVRHLSSVHHDGLPHFVPEEKITKKKPFSLSSAFMAKYAATPPKFGFNGLGELVYQRTYSRVKECGDKEQWFETVERVVNGTYNMQKRWIEHHELGWNARKAQTRYSTLHSCRPKSVPSYANLI